MLVNVISLLGVGYMARHRLSAYAEVGSIPISIGTSLAYLKTNI